MTVSSLQLYFFTGTGNSYRTALWLAELARTRGLAAEVTPIDAVRPAEARHGAGQMIGLVCPTHAFSAPWAMIRFALRLARPLPGTAPAAFAILTRGGMKAGRFFVPGLDGLGSHLLALILALKGYRVLGATGLDLPASWTALMPGLSPATAEAIIARARARSALFLERMLDGQRCFWSIIPALLGVLLLPVTAAYLLLGRFFLAKLFYASSNCDGCGLCARACPVEAIRMRGSRPPRPYWTFLCESCTRCMNYCPRSAVEASYPFGALAFYAANIPIAAFLLDWLARWAVQAAAPLGITSTPLVETIIQYPYKLLAIAVSYYLFTLVLRIPLANRLLTMATPTHYYRRYRAPETRLHDIRKGRQ